jgi:electron transfer flavoprotein beta subunit
MKILIPIKRVIDFTVKVRVKSDQSGVETDNVKHSMNPFDEIAMEEAMRWKEKGLVTEIVVVSIGSEAVKEVLRTGLARGADRAIHLQTTQTIPALGIAKILKAMVEREQPQLVIMGKQAIDDDNNQTGQMLAGLLNWPQATFASQIQLEKNKAIVTREIDGGLETMQVDLPCVITTDLRLNEPRYISLPAIMQAKRKTIEEVAVESLNIPLSADLKVIEVRPPRERTAGEIVPDVETLISRLRKEKVIG